MAKIFWSLSLALLLVECQAQTNPAQQVISTVEKTEFVKFMQDPQYLLLDVRTPGEFNEGHIPGAKNIDVEADTFEALVKQLNPEQPILIYCRTGSRSMTAAKIMQKNKFIRIINLKGGYEAWVEN